MAENLMEKVLSSHRSNLAIQPVYLAPHEAIKQ